MKQNTPEIIWKTIAPTLTPDDFGEGWEELRPEILIPAAHFASTLPDGHKIIIAGGHHAADGMAVHFRISSRNSLFTAHIGLVESFLRRHDLENLMAIGIYPEWDKGNHPGFHFEAERERRDVPRRWGGRYKRNEDGTLFLREGQPVEERVAWETALKTAGGGAYSV